MDNERNFKKYRTYSGDSLRRLALFDDGQFVLMDGSLILIEYSISAITIDVNGYLKNPNRWGYDLFTFQLMNDGRILPMGLRIPDIQIKIGIAQQLPQSSLMELLVLITR